MQVTSMVEKSQGIIYLRGSTPRVVVAVEKKNPYDLYGNVRVIFPKGHMEPNENPLMCFEREMLEEIGISYFEKVQPLKSYIYSTVKDGHPDQRIPVKVHVFAAEVYDDKLIVNKNELEKAYWMNVDDALKKVYYKTEKRALKELISLRGLRSRGR